MGKLKERITENGIDYILVGDYLTQTSHTSWCAEP